MPTVPAVLLRLLLCLCLLVDTVGPAMAATHLARAAVAETPGAADAAAGDCHAMADDAGVPPVTVTPEEGDCLERCLDLCLQHGTAALPATAALPQPLAGPPATHASAVQPGHTHAFPPLRPPIG